MNKLQASQYLYAKGPGATIKDDRGQIWTLRDDGCVSGATHGEYYGLPNTVAPFSIIEPENSNEELAREAYELWDRTSKAKEAFMVHTKFLLDVMDQKIKQAQPLRNEANK